ncbi:autotransporter-associated beta strand repeat-containing protein [Anatilimnocola sp. NA78]|uniref:autotransporter-associated beta strand repeat-containing protein n=1 Tax=Anatilimnocola sp. NA78 TaxID=3415683 RepID=UPI003CE4ADBD
MTRLALVSRQNQRARTLTSAKANQRVRRAFFEQLEDRSLLATLTWVGDVDGNWATSNAGDTNWSGNALPGDGDTLVFDGTGANFTQINDTTAGNSYTLQYSVGGYTLTGNSITLDNAADDIVNSGGNNTINTPFVVVADSTFNIDSVTTTLGGVISGGGGLIKTGTGTLTLSGANTFSGAVAVNAGTARIGHTRAFGAFNTAFTKVNVADGASVDFNGIIDATYGYTISGSGVGGAGALLNNAGGIGNGTAQASNIRLVGNAAIGGTGNWALLAGGYAATTLDLNTFTLTKLGGNTFTLANATITAGAIDIQSGVVTQIVNNKPGGHDLSGVAVSLANTTGAALNLNNLNLTVGSLSGGGTTGGNVGLGTGTLTVGNAASTIYAGIISGAGGLTKVGSGTLTLSGGSSFSGQVAVNTGTVQIGHTHAFGAFNTAVTKVIVASGASVDFNGVLDATYGYTITGTGVGGAGALLNNAGNIGTGTAQTTSIRLAGNAAIGGTGNWALLAAGYGATTLDLNGFTLTKLGGNTFTLANATITAGVIDIQSGVVTQIGNNKPAGHDLSGVAVSLANTAGAALNLNNLNLSVGSLSGGGAVGGNVGLGTGTLTVGNATSTTYAGSISGAGGITKVGAGVLTLSGSSSFGGVANINAGTARIGSSLAFGAQSAAFTKVVVADGASVDFNGIIDAAYGYTITGTGVGGVGALTNSGGGIGNFSAQASGIRLAGNAAIGGTGNWALLTFGFAPTTLDLNGFTLTKIGGNTFTLVNATITAGAIDIQGGIVTQTNSNKPGGHDLSAVAVSLANAPGVALDLNSVNLSVGSLTGGGAAGGNVNLGTGTLTVGNATSTSHAGVISGAGGLTKTGSGRLTFVSSNAYTGVTNVNQGVLNIQNNTALGIGAVNVLGGAVLEVQNGITVANALSLSTNAAIGTLRNVSGSNTWSGSILIPAVQSHLNIAAGDLTVSGSLTSNGYAVKNGPGTLILTGVNGGSGWMDVSQGVVSLRSDTAAVGTYFHVNNPSAVVEFSGGITIPSSETIYLSGAAVSGDATLRSVNGANTFNGSLILHSGTGNRNIGAAAGSSLTLGGVVSGTDRNFVKVDVGTVTLSGANTYTGTTSVVAGRLVLNNAIGNGAIFNTAGAVSVALGAELQLLASEAVSSYVGAGDGVGSNDSVLALGANTLATVWDATIANVTTAAGGGIVAGGAIIDGDDDNNVTGPNVFLQAATGIGAGNTLETSVSAIQLFNTTSGEINVLNSVGGLLTVSDLRTLGFGARNDGGATTVVNSSPLTIAANSISAGNVTFTATDDNDAPLLDDDLTINGGVTVQSTTANVFLNAGDDAFIDGNVSAALQVVIGVDVGDAELPAGPDATTGGTLTIANAAVITTPLAPAGGTYLNGNDDHDTFNLAPQGTTEFFINGNLPVGTSPGDTLNLDIAAAVNPLLTLGGIGAGTWTFGAPLRQVVYTSIEDVNANAPYHLALDANNTPFGNTNVDDHLTLSRSGADFVLTRTGDAIAPDDNDVGIVFQGDFATILSFTYLGSNDRDFLTINDLGGLVNFSGLAPGAGDNTNLAGQAEFFFDGGGNNDTLIFALTGPSASQTYAFGTNSGSTPSNTGEVLSTSNAVDLQTYFANVELVQRTGAGATPGALTVLGSDVADALSIAANLADTRVSMGAGYTPFDFSGDNFTTLNVNALAGADSLNLVSLGSGQTNDPAINLYGQGLFADDGAVDTLRVQSTSGNTGVVTLRSGLGGDLFQLFDAAPTVDFIAGPVVVDGSGGDMTFAVDRLEINDSGDLTGDTVALNALNGTDPDYVLTGLNASGVTFRNIDNLDYTGTSDADNINSQLTPTTTPHDLEAVILRGNGGNDQFRVFTSDQIGGTAPPPTGTPSGVTSVSLFGDAGLDTFGETPAGLVGTGAMNVGLVVAPTTQLIRPSTTTAITINGGIPTNPLPAPVGDIIGDTLNLDITSIPNTAPVVVAAGSSGVLNSAGQPVSWSEIEDLNLVDQGKLTNVQIGDLFARTTAANDLIQFSRNNTVAQPHRVRLRINSTFGDYNVSNKTIVYAGDGADYVTQANLTVSAEFYGEGGNDLLYGATNNDWLVGGLDNDSVNGGNGDNVLWGDNAPASTDVVPPQDSPIGGNDTLSGGTGNDVIYGGGGNDRLGGFDSNDYLHGGFGDDIADGGFGDDRVYGGAGNDQLAGYLGNDLLVGEAGNDILNGGSGNDVLIGGTGEDNMSGEFGNDLLITGSVANEHSTWTSVASVGPFSAATYSNATDNDAALLALLNIWGTSNLRTGLATITHDGVDDDVYGKLGDDDFCWEAADVADQGPTALSPPDFQVPGNGTDERFGPTM